MALNALELSDRLWRGEEDPADHLAMFFTGEPVEVADRTVFRPGFANISAFATGDGLVLVDTGNQLSAAESHRAIRSWSAERLHSAIYSHGHIDHVFGVAPYESEAVEKGWPAPVVVAHRHLPERFDRYILTAGYNGAINARQFQIPGLTWPTEYRYPDTVYDRELDLAIGDLRLHVTHALGETDDHSVTWAPDRKVLCCGDLFIWASPNAGNPQKVQRYPAEWAATLRRLGTLEPAPEVLLPGHGLPVVGRDRVREALSDTAALLESLVAQSLELMNAGCRLDELIHTVRAPAELLEKPYLRPVYDEPEFVVRNIWRRYGGWYDGNPASLKPAPESALALELADLAGGADRLAARAQVLAGACDDASLRLAGHLAELATAAAPGDAAAWRARAEVFAARARAEASVMARGVFAWAAKESRERGGVPGEGA